MSQEEIVNNYINSPFPLWSTEVVHTITEVKWLELKRIGIDSFEQYSTAGVLNGIPTIRAEEQCLIYETAENHDVYLENPSFDKLVTFYGEHGLEPLSENLIISQNVVAKLKAAITIIEVVPLLSKNISILIKKIQVLSQQDDEIDTSYSHPAIPFSIFVSVCRENNQLSALRVAESIIHEAMHLQLTLIEEIVPLIKADTDNLFYSPWRDERRPARGVLHGLFVFRAILEFYRKIELFFKDFSSKDFLDFRKEQIYNEVAMLADFYMCPDLTPAGATLTKNLLTLN